MVLRNTSRPSTTRDSRESALYQSYFEVIVEDGSIEKYPESQRPFDQLDSDEQSLLLLYRESATWAIGHGCAAGWDSGPEEVPERLYADVLPAVQTPSMTPDIKGSDDREIRLSMRALADLSDDGTGAAWEALGHLSTEYGAWIERKRQDAQGLAPHLEAVAERHLAAAFSCRTRLDAGLALLREDEKARRAFRFANLAMLLQQLSTKQLSRRPLTWNAAEKRVTPDGAHRSPWDLFSAASEPASLGAWRAFQIAFLLMSLNGVSQENSGDREIVDLIWFPTGGGKTEAYLAVMAYYMFHQRLLMDVDPTTERDGTNVLMRYTLRMLTTQQFQRAASLVCAMEFLRRDTVGHGMGRIPGGRFSLGLWLGSAGSPNDKKGAATEVNRFRNDKLGGNPLVLTECPWCRAEIGRADCAKPAGVSPSQWKALRVRGIGDVKTEGPLLFCPDAMCAFGSDDWRQWLPVEVIDERIYQNPPSLVIATADKLAMIAFRPAAGALFGRIESSDGTIRQRRLPPGLIVQDELHLISGPLGTMYGLYEAIFERLCSYWSGGRWVKPKLIASTATIRGAAEQVQALYARERLQLFPSPGLLMGDSFFGRYARHENGRLKQGRLYLGVHANDFGSVLTTQVRLFSSLLFRPYAFEAANRDAWWTLLVFYNSIRELGGAKTLFDSDIRSRLKFVFNREGHTPTGRRTLKIVEELTSRLSQAEIVGMMDRLSTTVSPEDNKALDACLASSIIEVGVDIDRLTLMGVVGQPKTTAQYIQVTGRVGRRWWERPGLIVTIYNPSKSRDRSHFEQFHSYHRRLYERVEPTSATPFALSAIQRAVPGALIAWARQHSSAPVQSRTAYADALGRGYELLVERCQQIQLTEDQERSLAELERVYEELQAKWAQNPQLWEQFPPSVDGEYLLLWPGQFATLTQKQRGVVAASSMRQVDGSAELAITQAYGAVSDGTS
ncbi:MAG: helicase-related protein [Dehalococcoidia bacterium]